MPKLIAGGLAAACTVALCAGTPVRAALPAPSASSDAVLEGLVQRWSTVHDYQADIDQHEVDGTKVEEHRIHYTLLLSPEEASMVVTGGSQAGMQIDWHGGNTVQVFHRGFLSFAKLSFAVTDKTVTSIRGNTVRAADPGNVLQCFEDHRSNLAAAPGPLVDGVATEELTMDRTSGATCPDDSAEDRAVTRDVLLISPDSDLPIERLRYVGTELVERWHLSHLKLNAGITSANFK